MTADGDVNYIYDGGVPDAAAAGPAAAAALQPPLMVAPEQQQAAANAAVPPPPSEVAALVEPLPPEQLEGLRGQAEVKASTLH